METIRNIGKINFISDIGDGTGRRIAKEFLNKILIEFAKQSTKYINAIYDAPFSYKERQLHSILAPALSKITAAFLMESPIERQWSKRKKEDIRDYTGWLDYWCRYKNVDFFIELKHNFDSYRTSIVRKETLQNWSLMNNSQLAMLQKEAKRYSEFCKGVLLVSLHVVTIYEYLQNHKEPKSIGDIEKLIEIQKNYYDKLNPSPNWSGLWILNENLIKKSKDEIEAHNQYYPGVMMIAKVYEIIN